MCNVYSWKVERSKVGDYSYLEINPEDSFATAATLGGSGRHYSFPQSHSHVRTIDEWKGESTLPFWKDVKINFLLQENVIEVWFTRTHGHTSTKQLVNYLSCIHCPSLQRTHLIHDIWDQCSLHPNQHNLWRQWWWYIFCHDMDTRWDAKSHALKKLNGISKKIIFELIKLVKTQETSIGKEIWVCCYFLPWLCNSFPSVWLLLSIGLWVHETSTPVSYTHLTLPTKLEV